MTLIIVINDDDDDYHKEDGRVVVKDKRPDMAAGLACPPKASGAPTRELADAGPNIVQEIR